MRPSRRPIIIAARQSALARVQAQLVGAALRRIHPHVEIDYRWVTSEGDQAQDLPLAEIGGKGLFTRTVEAAVLRGQADLAVHSLKDLPANDAHTGIAEGLTLVAIPRRGDPYDCLITDRTHQLTALPPAATLGTSSPRRAAQARRLRPDLVIEPLRGNVETRLRKVLEDRRHDATLLAAAGLLRLNLSQHTRLIVDPDSILPAAGQGALAVQCRADDAVTLKRCLPLNDPVTAALVNAERRVVAAMNGDCYSPIAVLAQPAADHAAVEVRLRARVLSVDGQRCVEADEQMPAPSVDKLVRRVTQQLLEGGALEVLSG